MRVATLTIVACCAALAVFGVAHKAQSRPVCESDLTATIGPPPPDTFVTEPHARRKAARLCPSPVKSLARLPTCSSGSFVTCRGTCSGGGEWFTWQCCIGQDGFPPQCGLNCSKEFAGCFAQ
jgi:hypothetical protein